MYYHPNLVPGMTPERALNAYRALATVWFDGIERHGAVHVDAMKDFCDVHVDTVRAFAQAEDGGRMATRLLSCAVAAPLRFVALASRHSGVAFETHRRAMRVLERRNEEPTCEAPVDRADAAQSQGDARRVRSPRQQMMA